AFSSEASTSTAHTRLRPVLALSSSANACACATLRSAIVISSKLLVLARSRVASDPIAPQPPRTTAFIFLPFTYQKNAVCHLVGWRCRNPQYLGLVRSRI